MFPPTLPRLIPLLAHPMFFTMLRKHVSPAVMILALIHARRWGGKRKMCAPPHSIIMISPCIFMSPEPLVSLGDRISLRAHAELHCSVLLGAPGGAHRGPEQGCVLKCSAG